MTDTLSTPRLSVVLATDSHKTIRPVLSALRRQASAREIEPVIVLLDGCATTVPLEDLSAFPHAKVVCSVNHLPEARAAGVRAASAPIVFIGETHSYPQPGWAEALLAAFDGPWAAVVPAIGNANPTGAASWASYLFDYGTWGPNRHSGEVAESQCSRSSTPPIDNAQQFRRHKALMRNTAANCFPSTRVGRTPQLRKTRGRQDGGRNLGFSCTVALPESINCQRATMQPPQGLDAKHGGEVFPVNVSSVSRQRE